MNREQSAWLSGSRAAAEATDRAVRGQDRASWAVGILTNAATSAAAIDCAREEIRRIQQIGADQTRWREAHSAFSAARQVSLRLWDQPAEEVCLALVLVAEAAAKVIYNAGGFPAPFDADSGVKLVLAAQRLAVLLN